MSDAADWERVHRGVFSPPSVDPTSIPMPYNQQPVSHTNGVYQGSSQSKQQQLPNHASLQNISQQPYPTPHLSSNRPFSTFGLQNASQRSVPPAQPRATSSATVNPVLLNPRPVSRSPSLAPAPTPPQLQVMPSVTGQKRSASSSRASSPSLAAGSDAKKQKPNPSVIDLSMSSPPPVPAAQNGTSQPMNSSLSTVLALSPVNATGTLDGYVTRDAQTTPTKAKEEVKVVKVQKEKKEKVKEVTPPRASPAPSSTKPSAAAPVAGPSKPKASTAPSSPVTMDTIRALITPAAFRSTMPIALFKHFWAPEDGKAPFKLSQDELMEVLVQIRDHAPQPWLKKMGVSQKTLEVWHDWLVEMRSNPMKWQWAMVPAFEILSKTEISADYTKGYKIAVCLKRLVVTSEENNLMNASALKTALAQYQAFAKSVFEKQAADSKKENVPAKRKIDTVGKEGGKENGESSSKRPATSSSTAARTASKPVAKASSSTAKPGAPAAKAAAKPTASKAEPSKNSSTKTDMSFFSAPPTSSAAARLKPRPPAAKPASPPAVSATASLLRSTLDNLNLKNAAAKADAEKVRLQPKEVRYTKSGRVIGTVKFRDAKLEEIKYFTAEPWEAHIEGGDEHSVHAMDMDEGRALAKARNHGKIVWYEPSPYYDPYPNGPPETPESIFQSERERGVLAAQVLPDAPVPNPSEDGVRIIAPHDNNTRNMVSHHPLPPPQPHALAYPAAIPPANIEEILKNLGDISRLGQPAPQERQPQYEYRSGQYQPPAGHGYPDQGQGGYYNHPGPSAPQQDWNNYQNRAGWQGQGGGYDHDSGRSHQGKGKNNKKGDHHGTRKCKFFASGHCLKGDGCTFAHY